MVKKVLLGMMAFATLFATSCTNELDPIESDNTASVSFKVETPTIESRAYSDGMTATVLQYAVYDEAGEILPALTVNNAAINGSATVELQLTTGNTYSVIFWAAAEGAPYTVNFASDLEKANMTVDYTKAVSNDENRDAFYATKEFTVTGAQTETIELKRPFAQLNIGTNDYEASKNAGYTPTQSAVTVKNIYKTLNFESGDVSVNEEIVFGLADINKGETFPVAGYEYLAMNYLLVGNDKETVDVEFTYADANNVAKTRTVGSVPVQRNYRTNIYGQLLTSDVDVNVEIKPGYDGSHEAEALFLAAAVGGEVTLTEDVTLNEALVVTANMTLNLNGKNITINTPYDSNNYEASSAIVNNANLTLIGNGTIKAENNYTVRNNGTMVIDGVTIENGIMNFNDLTIENGNISNSRSGKHGIYGNNAKLTINGGKFHNENAGNATIFSYGGEVIINNGEFTIADGTSTFGWTSCLIDVQGGAIYTLNGGNIMGEIRDYNKNTKVYGGVYTHSSVKNFVADGYKAIEKDGLYYVVADTVGAIVSDAAELKTEITNNTNQILVSGQIDLAEVVLSGYNGTIVGTEGAVLNTCNFTPSADEAYQLRSQNLTLKNLTIKLPTGGNWLQAGFVGTGVIVFENCRFEGQATLNGAANWTFNNCEFVSTESGAYASFVYGAEKATFNDCTFKGVDRAAKVYGTGGTLNVEYNNCIYTSTTLNKAGVEIDASYAITKVTLNGCSHKNMNALYALKGTNGTVNVE